MSHFRRTSRRFALGIVGLTSALWAGCTSTKPTELVSGVITQMQIPVNVKYVGFILQRQGSPALCKVIDLTADQGPVSAKLPSTLGAEPNGDPTQPVTITILAFAKYPGDSFESDCLLNTNVAVGDPATNLLVLRRARMPYVPESILYLPMPLRQSCAGVKCPVTDKTDPNFGKFDPKLTCKAGACVANTVDQTKLLKYRDDYVFGNTNTCFGAGSNATQKARAQVPCFDPALSGPPTVVEQGSCTYDANIPATLPPGVAPKGVNVRVKYADSNTEILDIDDPAALPDDQEGFSLPDPVGHPYRFKLAPNLCNLVVAKQVASSQASLPTSLRLERNNIIDLDASVVCASKTVVQPICDDDIALIQQTGSATPVSGAAPSTTPGCFPTQYQLTPSPSKLYILVDRGHSMVDFFNPKGLDFILGLSLQDPALETTKIAFRFFPSQVPNECSGANSFATQSGPSDVWFDTSEKAQPLIANLVGNPQSALATDADAQADGMLALSNVYAALDVPDAEKSTYNRRAALVVTNRDLGAGLCSPASTVQTVANLVTQARTQKGISTYAVELTHLATPGTPFGPGNAPIDQTAALASANTIATAGSDSGQGVFDATSNTANGLTALSTVINDLSSCLYQAPAVESPTDIQFSDYSLAYDAFSLSGATVSRPVVAIPSDATCAAGTATSANGWWYEGRSSTSPGRIRICGQYCTDLRKSLSDSKGYAAFLRQVSPSIGIRLTQTCSGTALPTASDGGVGTGTVGGSADGGNMSGPGSDEDAATHPIDASAPRDAATDAP